MENNYLEEDTIFSGETGRVIGTVDDDVKLGEVVISEAGQTFETISSNIEEISNQIMDISASMEEVFTATQAMINL